MTLSAALNLFGQARFVNGAMHIIAASILIHDHIDTLPSEIEYFWRRPKHRASYVFFLFRYLSLMLDVTLVPLALWDAPYEVRECVHGWLFEYLAMTIIVIVVSVLMSLRVYAIFGRDRRILWGLVVYVAAGLGYSLWIAYSSVIVANEAGAHWISEIPPCPLPVPQIITRRIAVLWIIVMGYDLIVFSLTMCKTIGALRKPCMPLTHLLLRDGALYFGTASIFNFANVLFFFKLGPYFATAVVNIGVSVSAALASRMMLHLHEETYAHSGYGEVHLTSMNTDSSSRAQIVGLSSATEYFLDDDQSGRGSRS
ncbi:hypothetical protein EV715DRAFT_291412 [Schizophyllum commune]